MVYIKALNIFGDRLPLKRWIKRLGEMSFKELNKTLQWCIVLTRKITKRGKTAEPVFVNLKVHLNENFFGFDFDFCPISLLVMQK